jgi:hypothetical protein
MSVSHSADKFFLQVLLHVWFSFSSRCLLGPAPGLYCLLLVTLTLVLARCLQGPAPGLHGLLLLALLRLLGEAPYFGLLQPALHVAAKLVTRQHGRPQPLKTHSNFNKKNKKKTHSMIDEGSTRDIFKNKTKIL